MRSLLLLSAALLVPSIAQASNLDVTVRSGGNTSITVAPGDSVNYEVVGELSDVVNEGLAFFMLDLEFDGAPLNAADTPGATPMSNFARPLGLTNPAGYGGTPVSGKLIQVGGAQNTIINTFASAPIGGVITGVAKKGSPQVLVTGALTAPLKVGEFTLKVTHLDANAIRQGQTGNPFWACDQAGNGVVQNLTVKVSALAGNPSFISLSSQQHDQQLAINAGAPQANRRYWMLGSFSGTDPGFDIAPGVHMPLNPDNYTNFLANNPHNSILRNEVGVTDSGGLATVVFHLPANSPPSVVGLTVNHAFFLIPKTFASDAASVRIDP